MYQTIFNSYLSCYFVDILSPKYTRNSTSAITNYGVLRIANCVANNNNKNNTNMHQRELKTA